jgi:hypothetical protein
VRRCDIILPDGLTTTPGASFDGCGTVVFLRGDSGGGYDLFSVGVGGVTVVKGVVRAESGGVSGRLLVSRLGRWVLESLKPFP